MPVTFMFISLWYSKPVKMWKTLLQFNYVNETFFKAKCSTSSFYIAACDKSTSEKKKTFSTFSHFLWPFLNYLPCRGKSNLGPTLFIICIQTSAFNICKKWNFYEHFSEERWESNIEIKQIYIFSNFSYSTRVISLKNVNVLSIK